MQASLGQSSVGSVLFPPGPGAQKGLVCALQIAEKVREAKGKGERERYTQLNAEFQKIAGRDKKAFLSEQCKEIVVNN